MYQWILQNKLRSFVIILIASMFFAIFYLALEDSDLKREIAVFRQLLTTSRRTTPARPTHITLRTTTMSTPTLTPSPDEWRLNRDVVPLEYNLTLNPDLETGLYGGTIKIHFENPGSLTMIRLHSFGLEFTPADVLLDNTPTLVTDVVQNPSHQIASLLFYRDVEPGTHVLQITFRGDMKNRIVGMYRSSYKNEHGVDRYIATTKFEPTYARQAFPCFDEPNFKAKYTVHLVKPKGDGYIALSNMNQIGDPIEQPDNKTELVSFNTSVPMSTYLACFIVCDFKYTQRTIKAKYGHDVDLKVYATPAQQSKTKFALDTAAEVTKFYIEYFGIEYPLPKLDMIAIPDFVSGAMEHWGLVTYRETALLYDEKVSSVANKKRVATVVAHELAHMWFGNLVTMNWWNDLWLNEGFATYMEYKSTDQIIPEWGLMDQFLIDELHPVFNFDATMATHPIVQTVLTPDEITEIFDAISYNKGASVLRMLENAAGEEKFRQGISNYLRKHKYANAVTKNLWDELQNVNVDFNVQDVMDTWTIQMGYPVVNVQKTNDSYTLTQKRFLLNPENENKGDPSIFNYKWTIPVTYITNSNPEPQLIWFDKSKEQLNLNLPGAKWVKFNSKQVGYYRVNYQNDHWNLLAANIDSMSISDRTHLLEESFSIAKSGQLNYYVPLNMTKYLRNETDYIPWVVAANSLLDLKVLLFESDIYPKYQEYVQSLVKPIYEKFTWDERSTDSDIQRQTRATVLNLACTMGYKECLKEASNKFNQWLHNNVPLTRDAKEYVYMYGMIDANQEVWNTIFEKYKTEIDAQEKIRLMKGLASVRDPLILSKFLIYAGDEQIVRSQDYFTCLQLISRNPAGRALVWDFVRENWDEIVNRFTLNDRYLGKLIPGITYRFSTKTKLNEMKAFFALHPDAGAGATARRQALETVTNNIKWLRNYKPQVEVWLNAVKMWRSSRKSRNRLRASKRKCKLPRK